MYLATDATVFTSDAMAAAIVMLFIGLVAGFCAGWALFANRDIDDPSGRA